METRRRAGTRSEPLDLEAAVPVLRIFSVQKADEFYLGYLGFSLDWEHRAGRGGPVYQQVSRSGLRLHLSEHHSDGSPGVALHLPVSGIRELHAELDSKPYPYLNPAVSRTPFGYSLVVIDPFGNQLRFAEAVAERLERAESASAGRALESSPGGDGAGAGRGDGRSTRPRRGSDARDAAPNGDLS